MRRHLALLAVLPLLLVACGTESEAEDPRAEAAVRKEIRSGLEHQLPAICPAMESTTRDGQIRRFLPRALKYCEGGDVAEIAVRSMQITSLVVDGETATAEVAPLGGRFDRQTVAVSLGRDANGEWRLDEAMTYAVFDPLALVRSFGDGLDGVAWTTPERRFGNCLVNRLKAEPAPDLEALALDPVASPFDSAVDDCASRFLGRRLM